MPTNQTPVVFRDYEAIPMLMINQNGDVVACGLWYAKTFQSGQKGTMIGTRGIFTSRTVSCEASPLADFIPSALPLHHASYAACPRLLSRRSLSQSVQCAAINSKFRLKFEAVIKLALQYTPGDRFPNPVA